MKLLLAMVLFLAMATTAQAQTAPQFQLGFKALAEQIPDMVGVPLEVEHYGANGDSLQKTSKGLMVWRKADNFTCFTDGATSWVSGPNGLQSRSNSERFTWEGDYHSEKLAQAIPQIMVGTLGSSVQRPEKWWVSQYAVYVSWIDDFSTKPYLQQHQWLTVAAISDWLRKNSSPFRPNVTLHVTSGSGVGNVLESTTSSLLLDTLVNAKVGQSEWLNQAQFKVVGQIY